MALMRLHMGPLTSSVIEHARQWIQVLGKMLHESAKESLIALKKELADKRRDLEK